MRQSVAPSAAGRQSVAVGRQSHAQGLAGAGASISSAAIQRKVLQKKRELEGVAALERASDLFLRRMIALAEDTESMADAGQGMLRLLFAFDGPARF
jgi:DASH complex subunit DAD2